MPMTFNPLQRVREIIFGRPVVPAPPASNAVTFNGAATTFNSNPVTFGA